MRAPDRPLTPLNYAAFIGRLTIFYGGVGTLGGVLSLLAFAVLLLGGCADDHAPKWRQVCTKSHTQTDMVMTFGGMGAAMGGIPIGSGMHLVPQTTEICDAQVWSCDHGGRDYTGDRACIGLKPGAAP